MQKSMMRMAMIAAAVLGASAACGQGLKADVPFDFRVVKTTLPAGEYKISKLGTAGGSGIYTIHGAERTIVVAAATTGVEQSSARAQLSFRCGSSGCLLAGISDGWSRVTFPMPHAGSEHPRTETVVLTGGE